jgi:hypothetical protein
MKNVGIDKGCISVSPFFPVRNEIKCGQRMLEQQTAKQPYYYVRVSLNNKPVPSCVIMALNRSLLEVKIRDCSITQWTDCQLRSMAAHYRPNVFRTFNSRNPEGLILNLPANVRWRLR